MTKHTIYFCRVFFFLKKGETFFLRQKSKDFFWCLNAVWPPSAGLQRPKAAAKHHPRPNSDCKTESSINSCGQRERGRRSERVQAAVKVFRCGRWGPRPPASGWRRRQGRWRPPRLFSLDGNPARYKSHVSAASWTPHLHRKDLSALRWNWIQSAGRTWSHPSSLRRD